MIQDPYQKLYIYFYFFIILQFNFFRHSIVEKTSSLKRTFDILEIPWLIEPIKKALIEIDLSESRSITLLNSLIFY